MREIGLGVCRALVVGLVLGSAACSSGGASGDGVDAGPDAGGGGNGADGGSVGDGGGESDGGGVDGGSDGGANSCGPCAVEFAYPAAGVTGSVELRGNFSVDGWATGVPLALDGDRYVARVSLPHDRAVQYKFVVDGASWVTDPARSTSVFDGISGRNSVTRVDCGCGGAPSEAFDWRDAVIYFALVDRFVDGDPGNNAPLSSVETPADYAGGDLAGVKQKLEEGYFTELGTNVLWLTAPVDNADAAGVGSDGRNYSAYHGYWPSDLDAVESRVGDLALLREVVDAAHARGIRVVLDYVMNHVHVESPVYAQHADWFWPLQDGGRTCVCGEGCGWEGGDGLRCWFRSYLPDFDFRNAAARAFSVSNALGWIKRTGVDGFRLDAVKHIEMSWITDLRARLKAEIEFDQQRFYLVGETFSGERDLIKSYVDPATKLDGQFDFPLRSQVARILLMRQGSMGDLAGFLAGNDSYYGAGAVMGTFLGNHDLPRAIHLAEDTPLFGEWDSGQARGWTNRPELPGYARPFQRLLVAYALLWTIPGAPLVYYGDEIGMPGGGDPDNRRPMAWTGVTSDQRWLRKNVARLSAIRAAQPALRRGTRTTLGSSGNSLVYRMSDDPGTDRDDVWIALNRGDDATDAPGLPAGTYRDLLGETDVVVPAQIPARTAWILVRR